MKYSFDPDTPIIVVEANLKGEKVTERLKMALDTGVTYTMIPWKAAEILGLKPEMPGEKVDITTASGVQSVPLVVVNSLSLGTMSIEDTEVVVHDLPERSHVDGLLGLSFLRNFKICMDFKEGVLEIE